MYTNTIATLYNKYVESHETLYKRTVLDSVHWEGLQGVASIRLGNIDSNSVLVSIPFSVNVKNNIFVKNKAFEALVNKNGYYTFNANDVIVKGEIPDSVEFEELEGSYDDVITIESVNTADYGSLRMRHWEILGK